MMFSANAASTFGGGAVLTAALAQISPALVAEHASQLDSAYSLFMAGCAFFAVLYLRGLHKKVLSVDTHATTLTKLDRWLRSVVRILAAEADEHGSRRSSDLLITALKSDMDEQRGEE